MRHQYLVISDTHFGHQAIKDYENRPEDFEDRILRNLKARTQPGQVIIHLGDFCLKSGSEKFWHKKFMEALPGRKKWLVMGNHDRKSPTWYLRAGWDMVGHTLSLRIAKTHVIFSHQPLVDLGEAELNVHGHMHTSAGRFQPGYDLYQDGRHYLVACEHEYTPISLLKIVQPPKKRKD